MLLPWVYGCHSWPQDAARRVEVAQVPPWLAGFFGGCEISEGNRLVEANLAFLEAPIRIDHDWIYDARRGVARFQLTDPLGRVVLDGGDLFDRQSYLKWRVNRLQVRSHSVARDAQGFLVLADHTLPLLYAELPCIFYGQLPQRWLHAMDWWEVEVGTEAARPFRRVWQHEGAQRRISLAFSKAEDAVRVRFETTDHWFFWTRRHFDWVVFRGQRSVLRHQDLGQVVWKRM
ncbi:MAG: hypothetical protein OXT67_09065 [Zetaproteobacteria bacterium]|nr:hypothetical protein [Zetaproteobacteria bacterium]